MTGDDAKLAVNPEAPQRQNTPTLRLGDFLNSERAALNKLASMYGGQVKADVKLGGIAWDGLIKTQSDHIVVEIKHVSPGQRFDPDSFKITLVQMIRSRRSGMADAGVRVPEIAVIIIVHDPAPEKLLQVQEIAARVSDLTGASVWVWPSNELSYAAS